MDNDRWVLAPEHRMPDRRNDVVTQLAEREFRLLLQLRRYEMALTEIVNVLGPNGLCQCHAPCEQLREEAAAALEIAHAALQRGTNAHPEEAS